jgi:DNA-binding Xre family transcriptional regulator
MSQVDQFLSSLKRSLKSKNIIYKDLALALELSESSVKRILSDKTISLERIEEICKACDLSFAEVCKNANFEEALPEHRLSKDQEKVLADNPRLLHYFLLLNDKLSPKKIETDFDITANESKKLLLMLDRLNLIELHPRDRVKLKNPTGSLIFRRDGAVGKALFLQAKNHYLNSDFEGDNNFIRFSAITVPPAMLVKYKKKLEKLLFEISEEEKQFEGQDDKTSIDMGILVAYRPWKYSSLDAIKKKKS